MNNGRWKDEDIQYLLSNAGKITLAEMAKHLNKTELAVKLFMHRRKMTVGQTVKRNIVLEMLRTKFRHPENFMPNRAFYNEVGINQMRWWDLYHGKKQINQREYIALSEYLGITLQEAFEARQLDLFNTEENER